MHGIMATSFLSLALLVRSGVTDDLVPCVVFLKQQVPAGKESKYGSGFLVKMNDRVFIVTASHVATAVGEKFSIVVPGAEGHPIMGEIIIPKWQISKTADVALALIEAPTNEENIHLLQRCMPSDFLTARTLPPSRETPLTVMGYPLGLGVEGYISPLSIETRAASGLITMPRADNKQLATFILLQDPSIAGLSGGPVFDTGNSYFEGRKMNVRSGVSVVGLIHGVISDATGGKFAAIVPSTEILALLNLVVAEEKR